MIITTKSYEEWKNGSTLIMRGSRVFGVMKKKMSRNRKFKVRWTITLHNFF